VIQAAAGFDSGRDGGQSSLRWWVLLLAAIAVSSSYYEDDVIGPIADLLQRQRGFSQSQLGMLNGVISIPNVALALINGVLIDRYGAARVALWAAAIGVVGAALTAVGTPYELMVAGRFVFGISEGAIFIALVAGLAQWFSRSGIALARHGAVPEPRPSRLLCSGYLDGVGPAAIRGRLAAAAVARHRHHGGGPRGGSDFLPARPPSPPGGATGRCLA